MMIKKMVDCFSGLLAWMINRMPGKMPVAIKERIRSIKKLDYHGGTILLDIDSTCEYSRLYSCRKEPETIRWIHENIIPGDVVVDIGANIGAYSLVIDSFTNGGAKIYAIEPSAANFVQLCKNIIINNASGRIVPVNVALSDVTSVGVFNYSSMSSGSALHAFGLPIDYKQELFKPVFEQLLYSYKLDDLLSFYKIESPNHIKLDVDGIELSILLGASNILNSDGLRTVMVEVEEAFDNSIKIVDLMSNYGFSLSSASKRGGVAQVANYLFMKK